MASLSLAERQGRRVVRCVELTPGEEVELLQRIGDRAQIAGAIGMMARYVHPERALPPVDPPC